MCTASRPRVLIADDHTLVAEALERILATDFEVVAKVHDGRSLIRAAQRFMPAVILVDIGMPLLNGMNAAERIKRITPGAKIIFVTINRDPEVIAESLRRGADGYILKTCAASELVTAIHSALRGDCYISAALEACAPPQARRQRQSEISCDRWLRLSSPSTQERRAMSMRSSAVRGRLRKGAAFELTPIVPIRSSGPSAIFIHAGKQTG